MVDVELEATSTFGSPVVERTKLVPPRLRAETVERPALVTRRLASPARLGVITGSAGSGKSILLAQCHAVDPFPAWLSLGPADNNPVSLWLSMVEALRAVLGDFADTFRAQLLAAGVGAVDDIIVSVCNELAERDTPIHLFLDDLHLVDNVTCRRSLLRFVSTLPAGVRVTVASRLAAALPLARLRASGDVVEIGALDLPLTRGEAHQLLTAFDISLDQEHLDLILARTEGWPAGVQLAGLAMARATDVDSFIEDFHGTDRDIADYLLSEVLGTLSDEDRDFMVETSILGKLTGDLCDAVTGRRGGAETLARLELVNAFVIPLDRDHRWYRYHHLFGELIAAELNRTRPDEERDLHREAFEWLRDDGQIAEAIPHALAAGEPAAAAELVCMWWGAMMDSGSNEIMRSLLASFRPEYVADHQPLAIAAAGVHAMAGDTQEAQRWLRAAERTRYDGPRPDGMASVASSVALCRGFLAPHGVDAALADGHTALELEPPGSGWWTLANLIVGRSLVLRGDVDEPTEFFEEVERTSPVISQRTYALAELSLGYLSRGDAELAKITADAACELLGGAGAEDFFVAALAYAALALAALDLGDQRTARMALRAAARPMTAAGQALPMDATHTRLVLARAALALGEAETARGYLRDAKQVIDAIDDVGVMGKQYAELAALLDTLDPGTDGDSVPEFTERELEVIALLPGQLTTQEIGDELFLSRNTIKTYLRRVYRKLNASTREEAVLTADELGLLSDRTD